MFRSLRTPLLVAVAGAVGLVVVYGLAYAATPIRTLDGWVFRTAQTEALGTGINPVGELLVAPMQMPLYAVLCVGAALVARRNHGWWAAVGVAALLLVTNGVAQTLKVALAADRPWSFTQWGPVDAASWPSGHATASAILVVGWALAVAPGARRTIAVVGGAWAALVGCAVVWMGWHMPSDTLGGWCLVAGTGGLAVAVARSRAVARRRPLRPAQSAV